MEEFEDAVLGYGQSDEYSFIFRREAEVIKCQFLAFSKIKIVWIVFKIR